VPSLPPLPHKDMAESRFVLDRIEDEDHAVLVASRSERALIVPRSSLPAEAVEGDVLNATPLPEGGMRLEVDPEATRRRRLRMEALRDSLPGGPSGDLSL